MAGKSLVGLRHAHGCRRCASRYEDACLTPAEDGLCITCRGGRGWDELMDNCLPAACCREQARLVTKDQKATYRLAGSRLWFICPSCARTHPYNPRTESRPT